MVLLPVGIDGFDVVVLCVFETISPFYIPCQLQEGGKGILKLPITKNEPSRECQPQRAEKTESERKA